MRNKKNEIINEFGGRNGGEGELTDSDGGAKFGGEAGGSNTAAAGSDGEEVEVVVGRRLGTVLEVGASGEGAAGMGVGEVERKRERS